MPRYQIVPEHSRVRIDARSNVHPIHSSTDGLEGWVELEMGPDGNVDLDAKSSGQLSLSVDRLSSGNRLQDRELYKRIDARRFPTIEGALREIGSEDSSNSYRVSGDVTFRGVTRQCEDRLTIDVLDAQTIQLTGRSRFDIRDFEMTPPRILMLRVEPEVDVSVEIHARKEA